MGHEGWLSGATTDRRLHSAPPATSGRPRGGPGLLRCGSHFGQIVGRSGNKRRCFCFDERTMSPPLPVATQCGRSQSPYMAATANHINYYSAERSIINQFNSHNVGFDQRKARLIKNRELRKPSGAKNSEKKNQACCHDLSGNN